MNVISRKILNAYIAQHAETKEALLSWYQEACQSNWQTPRDIKARYRSASFLGENIVIFNIKGNKYRLVTKLAYRTQTVFITWIGTHAEYTKRKF